MKINTKAKQKKKKRGGGCVLLHLFNMRHVVGPSHTQMMPSLMLIMMAKIMNSIMNGSRIKHLLIADGPAVCQARARTVNWFFIFVRISNNCDHQQGNKSRADRGEKEKREREKKERERETRLFKI